MNIKGFLKANGLRQVDLAKYLGISDSAVSVMSQEKSNPSGENLNKILNNDQGWDTSMLFEPVESISVRASGAAKTRVYSPGNDGTGKEVELLTEQVKFLTAALEEEKARSERYLAMIEKLMER